MSVSAWLHVNGVSLSTDVHPQITSDNRTKTMTSPIPEIVSSPNSMPFTMANQQQKIDKPNLPKKLFVDRQIRKVKSLPGLIK